MIAGQCQDVGDAQGCCAKQVALQRQTVPVPAGDLVDGLDPFPDKQCGRGRLPEVRRPEKLDDLLAGGGPCVFAAAGGETPDGAARALAGAKEVKLFVGPEGGFTKGELDFARSRGAVFMDLGLYTLRAETACLAAASALPLPL